MLLLLFNLWLLVLSPNKNATVLKNLVGCLNIYTHTYVLVSMYVCKLYLPTSYSSLGMRPPPHTPWSLTCSQPLCLLLHRCISISPSHPFLCFWVCVFLFFGFCLCFCAPLSVIFLIFFAGSWAAGMKYYIYMRIFD